VTSPSPSESESSEVDEFDSDFFESESEPGPESLLPDTTAFVAELAGFKSGDLDSDESESESESLSLELESRLLTTLVTAAEAGGASEWESKDNVLEEAFFFVDICEKVRQSVGTI
jgi:hypothetical protein